MSQAGHQRNLQQSVSLAALFVAFLTVSLCGFGGRIVWAREALERNAPNLLADQADIRRVSAPRRGLGTREGDRNECSQIASRGAR